MGPKAQRSRACNQCRDRRVKCDETPGFCEQCRRLGLKCSGPIQGSVIIDMTDKVTKPRQRKKKEKTAIANRKDVQNFGSLPKTEERGSEPDVSTPAPAAQPQLHLITTLNRNPPIKVEAIEDPSEGAIAVIRAKYKLPMLYQPSLADAFDTAFIAHFVELNKGVRSYTPEIPFGTLVPGFHTKAHHQALKLSIRATSMAFYAKVHGDIPILAESYKWYTKSLCSQRLALSKLVGDSIPDEEECLVPIILGLYEVYAGTSSTTVFNHLTAATRLFAIRGPRSCSSGPLNDIFKAVRVSDAHKAVMLNQPSIFSSQEWLTLPSLHKGKNAHGYLTDIILKIPLCIALCDPKGTLSDFFANSISPHINLKPVHECARQLLCELEDWAARNPHLCYVPCASQLATPITPQSIGSLSPATPQSTLSQLLVLPDTFIALAAASYQATHLILTLLVNKVTPPLSIASVLSPGPGSNLMASPIKQSQSIMEIGSYVERIHPVGFDFMRSTFPLMVVAMLAPQQTERDQARQMLDRWGKRRGVEGLCSAWGAI